jgi:hypothetical protein
MTTKNPQQARSGQLLAKPEAGKGYLNRYLHLLAQPPVLPTELADDYWLLMAELFNELKPASVLEAHYIEDVVYNSWQIRRLRQVQADLVRQAMVEIGTGELASVLYLSKRSCFAEYDSESSAAAAAEVLMIKAVAGDKQAATAVEDSLVEVKGHSWAMLHALAIDQVLTSYGRLEQMIHLCERQRQDVFKDLVFLGQAKAMLLEQRSNETITEMSGTVIPETLDSKPAAGVLSVGGSPGANSTPGSTNMALASTAAANTAAPGSA